MRMTRFGIAFLIVALLGVVALGQEPILSFSADPPVVRIAPGGEATVRVVAANNSVHPGDGLTIEVSAPDGLVVTPERRASRRSPRSERERSSSPCPPLPASLR